MCVYIYIYIYIYIYSRPQGPQELHKLFNWANRSKRGLVLFVDEAQA